jgi:hypothetical protein
MRYQEQDEARSPPTSVDRREEQSGRRSREKRATGYCFENASEARRRIEARRPKRAIRKGVLGPSQRTEQGRQEARVIAHERGEKPPVAVRIEAEPSAVASGELSTIAAVPSSRG